MSQAVNLDIEFLQRIKFLIEYDVSKTSSENILVEQDLGLKGKTIASDAKPPVGFGKSKGGSSEKTLEEFTVDVRQFMSRWETATIETIATILGIGIPIVITANGFWLTLEIIQAVKGNPDYLSLVFSFISTATAGAQSGILKPLYGYVSKLLKGSGSGIVNVLDAIYEGANKLGVWNKLKPILEGINTFSNSTIDEVTKGLKWLNDNVLWIFKGVIWLGKETIGLLSKIKTYISGLFNTMDIWLANIGRKVGIKPQVAQKIGSAIRWGTVPGLFKVGEKLPKDFSGSQKPITQPIGSNSYTGKLNLIPD